MATFPQGDGNVTPQEASVAQSPFQQESSSHAVNSMQEGAGLQSADTSMASPLSAVGSGLLPKPAVKRTRGPGKQKSAAAKAKEGSPMTDRASLTPTGPAESLSSSSGENKSAKGPRITQQVVAGQQNLEGAFARAARPDEGSES